MVISTGILAIAPIGLAFWLFAFAHSRVLEADLCELDRLRQEGLLPATNSLEEDFQTVTSLLNAIAPTVYMRQATWIRAYYLCLRASRAWSATSAGLENELRRLVALQSSNYRRACARLADYGADL